MDILEQIKGNEVYKQILSDSFVGVMYDVANRGKYNTDEIVKLWDSLTASEKEMADGIIKGVFNFIKG